MMKVRLWIRLLTRTNFALEEARKCRSYTHSNAAEHMAVPRVWSTDEEEVPVCAHGMAFVHHRIRFYVHRVYSCGVRFAMRAGVASHETVA